MSRQGWGECLVTAESDGSAVTGTSAGTLLPSGAKFTLPANFFDIGKTIRVRAAGRISNIVTTPGTLTFNLLFGATNVFASGAVSLNTTAKTNVSWWMDLTLTCRTIGSSGTLMGIGEWNSESVVGAAAGTRGSVNLPASAPTVGGTFDTQVSQQVDLQAIFSLTGNSIQLHIYELWAEN
jgi:hypothetical protein